MSLSRQPPHAAPAACALHPTMAQRTMHKTNSTLLALWIAGGSLGCLEAPQSRYTDDTDAAVTPAPDVVPLDTPATPEDTGPAPLPDNGPTPSPDNGPVPTTPAPSTEDAGAGTACRALGNFFYRHRSRVSSHQGSPVNSFGSWLPRGSLNDHTYLFAYNGRAVSARNNVTVRLQDDPVNASWDTCVDCILLADGCTSEGRSCQRFYLSSSGYARYIAVAATPGQEFRGIFSAVVLREVVFTSNEQSRFVDGGACLSLESLEFATTADDGCSQLTTCDACAATNGCGWCQNTQRCTPGSASGPTNATCGGTQWQWLPAQCTAGGLPDAGTPDAGPRDAGVDSAGLGGAGMGPVETSFAQNGTGPYSACTSAGCVSETPTCVRPTGRTEGVCAVACTRDAECPSAGVCIRYGTVGYCMRPCVSTCPTGQRCVSYASLAGPAARVCAPTSW